MSEKNKELSWEKVEKYLSEKTDSGNMMALVETEKLFKEAVSDFDLPGDDLERQISALSFVYTDANELEKTRALCKKIVEKENFTLTKIETIKNLEIYYQAITDLSDYRKKKISAFKKTKLYLQTFLPSPKDFFKKYILIFFIFFLTIFLLDSTSFGRILVDIFVSLSHLIFSWVLFIILLIAGIAILVVGTVYYFQSKHK
ncbi:MAG: hypothetical protein WC663_01685 [Patescibacteria group bacterium]|jgi:hypothetical protein